MAAVRQQADKHALKNLVPLNGLSRPHFDELVSKSEIKDVAAGRYLFREGERDGNTYFLLSGEIALMQSRKVQETIKAGSEAARHPIAHQQPRQVAAKAQGRITVLAVDSGLLDVMLAWDQSGTYEVTEIQSEDDEDWMTRMLQSELFQRLPANNIQQVLMRMEEQIVTAGTAVVRQDEEGDYYYMIKQGRAEVSRKAGPEAKPVRLAELGDGEGFGEEALLSGARRNADVTMLTDGVLMRLSKVDFDALLREPLINQVDFERAGKLVGAGGAWLDVRLPGEYQNGHLPGSTNIPLAALRERLAELQPGCAYVVCCDTGTRSHGAAFLLSQRGLDTYVLAGGLNAVPRDALTRAPEPQADAEPASGADVVPLQGHATAADDAELTRVRAKAAAFLKQARQQAEGMRSKLEAAERQVADKQEQVATLDQALQDKQKELRELHRSFERAEAMGEEVEQLRAEITTLRAQTTRQQQDLEHAHHAAAEREQELTLLRDQVEELEQGREALSGEAAVRADLEAQLEQVAGELADARDTIQRLQQERDQAAGELEQRVQGLQAEKAALEERVRASEEAARGEREALEEQLQSRSAELETLRVQLTEQSEGAQAAAARVQALEQALVEARQGDDSAQTDLAQARARADELEQRLQALESQQAAELEQLRRQLEESEAAGAALRGELEQRRTDQQAAAEARHQELQESLEAARTAQQTAEQEREALRAELEQTRETLRQRQADLEGAVADSARASELQQQLEEERQRAQAQHAELDRELEDLRGQLTTQRAAAESQARELEERLAALSEERDRERGARDQQEASLAAERARLEQVQQKLEATETELDRYRRAAEQAEERAAALQRSLDADEREVDARVATLQEEAEALRRELGDARARVDEAERQVQREEHRLQEVESERSALAADLERQSEQHRQALDSAAEGTKALEARVGELERGVAEAEAAARREAENAGELDRQLHGLREELERERATRAQAEAQGNALETETAALRDQLGRAQDEAQELRTRMEGEGADSRTEVDSIRALADQELRQAAAELKRLQQELSESQQRVRQLDAELAIANGLGADGASADGQRIRQEMDERLARYKQESEAALADVRSENARLREALQRLGSPEGDSGTALMADAGAVERAMQTADRNDRLFELPSPPRRRRGVWVGVAAVGVLVSASAGWFLLHRPAAVPASAPAASEAPRLGPQPVSPESGAPVTASAASAEERAPALATAPRAADPPSTAAPKPAAEPQPAPRPTSFRDALADGGQGPVMVRLDGGRFTMGSPGSSLYFDERPPRAVKVGPFSIGRFEVTFEDFDRFAEATGRRLPDDGGRGRGNRPVVNVTWDDARAYAGWLSEQTGRRYRLPTEAEWEYAARAGTDTFHWWGMGPADGRANCFSCGSEWDGVQAAPVGSFAANPLGLHDTAGNVMEWVRDCYGDSYEGAPTDGAAVDRGDCDRRVARGGSYRSVEDNVRSAKRIPLAPDTRSDEVGFRLVRQ